MKAPIFLKSVSPELKLTGLSAVLSGISVLIYAGYSHSVYRFGFPLDDAWIHQTYARNLALSGEWAFVPGVISGGSTSPLWSLLLAAGHMLRVNPLVWTGLIAWLALTGFSLLFLRTTGYLLQGKKASAGWMTLLLGLEWHIVWAAMSGMETALYGLAALLCLALLVKGWDMYFWSGALVGLSTWLRPDGLTLLAPVFFVIVLGNQTVTRKVRQTVELFAGFALLFLPYLGFNRAVSGAWWPNTFFAKQAEYAIELQAPLLSRLAEQALLPLVGAGAILLPGFAWLVYRSLRLRRWSVVAGALWAVGYLGLYALRLPVSYQHGRYVIPMMPMYFAWGLAGMLNLAQPAARSMLRRVVSRAWQLSFLLILLAFWGLGMRSFGNDVAFIESEMVDTARWIAQNTPPDALLAAHDIGALGYYGQHTLLDLAGLASPEVIPFIRDEARLAMYLDVHAVDYLVTFPGWYPQLTANREVVYRSPGIFAVEQGYENMAIFLWLTLP
jgi:arabinofuranosyltransferase